MTSLAKPVRRKTRGAFNVLYSGARNARPIVVALVPGDVIEFRELGRRQRYLLAVDTAFKVAVRLHAQHEAAERRAARKGKR
jgi:hypothetical protein